MYNVQDSSLKKYNDKAFMGGNIIPFLMFMWLRLHGMVTAKKFFEKKFSELKSHYFGTKKVLWKKVLEIKVSGNKVLTFWDFIFIQKNLRKKSPLMETNDVHNHGKKGLHIKMHKRKVLENASDLTWFFKDFSWFCFSSDLFSLGLWFLWSYFLRLYWQPPYHFRRKVRKFWNFFSCDFPT